MRERDERGQWGQTYWLGAMDTANRNHQPTIRGERTARKIGKLEGEINQTERNQLSSQRML